MTAVHVPSNYKRYNIIDDSLRDVKDDDLEFADFLRSKERSCCPDGYVDSQKFQYQYKLRSPGFDVNRSIRPEGARTPRGPPKVISVSLNRDRIEQEYADKLRRTEEIIRKTKHQQRELKRQEGNMLKHKREIRVEKRDYERNVTKEQYAEDLRLAKGMQKYSSLQQQANHTKTTLVHQRMLEALDDREESLNSGRKVMHKTLGLSRQYRAKMDALRLKQQEVDRLMSDYEKRLRLKEEEERAIARELKEIGTHLGLEVMKSKTLSMSQLEQQQKKQDKKVADDLHLELDLEDKLKHGTQDQKQSVLRQRKLSANLKKRREELSMSNRQDDRSLIDTRTRLADIQASQRFLNTELYKTDLERNRAESEQKLAETVERRQKLSDKENQERRQTNADSEAFYSARAAKRATLVERTKHEDSLRHLQKEVTRGEDEEMSLYQRVRSAESRRQNEEQQVRRLQSMLQRTVTSNSDHIRQNIAASLGKEKKLQEDLMRAKARLASETAEREEAYRLLELRRAELEKDRLEMQKEKVEHDRLLQIGQRSDRQ